MYMNDDNVGVSLLGSNGDAVSSSCSSISRSSRSARVFGNK